MIEIEPKLTQGVRDLLEQALQYESERRQRFIENADHHKRLVTEAEAAAERSEDLIRQYKAQLG